MTVRALIDQGSVTTLVTESLVQNLRLSKTNVLVRVVGIGEKHSMVRHAAMTTITSVSSEGPACSPTAFILSSLTKYMPSQIRSNCDWKHISELELADKELLNNDSIDIIIGADLFGQIIFDGVRTGFDNESVGHTLGWIIFGPVPKIQLLP